MAFSEIDKNLITGIFVLNSILIVITYFIVSRFTQGKSNSKIEDLQTSLDGLETTIAQSVTVGMTPIQSVINNLNSVFYSDRKTGDWGDRRLDALLQDSGYRLGIDYQSQIQTEGGRPDYVKFNAYGNKTLVIDSKLPTANFFNLINAQNTSVEGESLDSRKKRLGEFHDLIGFNVIERIKECKKYNKDSDTLGITLMYIDVESLFIYIMKEKFKETPSQSKTTLLYEYAEKNDVLIVSPTTLSLVLGHINIVKEKFKIAEQHKDLEDKLKKFIKQWDLWTQTIDTVEKQTKDAMTLLGHEKGVLNELRLYEGDRRTKLDKAVDKIKGLLN